MVQGQVFLKREGGGKGWYFSFLIFSRFIIFRSRNYYKKLCYVFEEKLFFLPTWFYEKSHSKLSKNEPKNIP